MTSGTATAPASRSHRRPAASAAKNPLGGSGERLGEHRRAVLEVSRWAAQIDPPATGVSRMR